MKKTVERSSRVTRRSSGNRQSSRSKSGSSKKRSASGCAESTSGSSKKRSASACEESTSDSKRKRNSDSIQDKSHETQMESKDKNKAEKKDKFCWVCHKYVRPEDTVKFCCPDCPRIYHGNCCRKTKGNSRPPVCECKWTTVDGSISKTNEFRNLQRVLRLVYLGVIKSSPYKSKEHNKDTEMYSKKIALWPGNLKDEMVCKAVDFTTIEDKTSIGKYKCTGELFQDAKWIHHNWCIVDHLHEHTPFSQKFEKAIKQQLSIAEGCAECYLENEAGYSLSGCFNKVCSDPHPIVWAKIKGFPYWPAKCLRILNGHADVRFFGTHDRSLVPLAQVYKISMQNPGGTPKKSKNSLRRTGYEQAMEELSEYIGNYEDRHGTFLYFDGKTPLIATKNSGNKKRQNKNKSQNDVSFNIDGINAEPSYDLGINAEPSFNSGINAEPSYNSGINAEPSFNSGINAEPSYNSGINAEPSCNSDVVDTKGSIIQSCFSLNNNADENNEAVSEMESDILCQMTFEEGPSEISASDEMIELVPVTQAQFSEMYGQNLQTFIQNSQELQTNLSSFERSPSNTEVAQISSDVSSSTPLRIMINSLNKNFPDQVMDTSESTDCENPLESLDSRKKAADDVSHPSTSSAVHIEDDDEIQIISETFPKYFVDNAGKSLPLSKTFCELLFGNKPRLRNCIRNVQNVVLRMYIMMWLEINSSKLSDFKKMNLYYEDMCRTIIDLTHENDELKNKNAELKTQIADYLAEKKKRAAAIDLITQQREKKHFANFEFYKEEVKKLRNDLRIQKESFNTFSVAQKNEMSKLESLLKEKDQKLSDKEEEIEHLKRRIEVLEKQEEEINNKNEQLKEYENLAEQLEAKEKVIKNLEMEKQNEYEKMRKEVQYIVTKHQKEIHMRDKALENEQQKVQQLLDLKKNNHEKNCDYQKELKNDAAERFSIDSDSSNLDSSIEHIVRQKVTNVQVVEFSGGMSQYSQNTTMQSEQHIQQSNHPSFLQSIPTQMFPFATVSLIPVNVPQTSAGIVIHPESEPISSVDLSSAGQNNVNDPPKSKSSKDASEPNVSSSDKEACTDENKDLKKVSKRKRK